MRDPVAPAVPPSERSGAGPTPFSCPALPVLAAPATELTPGREGRRFRWALLGSLLLHALPVGLVLTLPIRPLPPPPVQVYRVRIVEAPAGQGFSTASASPRRAAPVAAPVVAQPTAAVDDSNLAAIAPPTAVAASTPESPPAQSTPAERVPVATVSPSAPLDDAFAAPPSAPEPAARAALQAPPHPADPIPAPSAPPPPAAAATWLAAPNAVRTARAPTAASAVRNAPAPAGSGAAPAGMAGDRVGRSDPGSAPPGARLVGEQALDPGFRLSAPVEPPYPAAARRVGLPGRVLLELEVDPDGRVTALRILEQTPGWGFGEAARQAYAGARFSPPTVRGEPVRVRWRKTLHFRP